MSNIYDDISSTMTYMRHRGVNPNVIYVDSETYEMLNERVHMQGVPIVCDDGLCMKYRID